MKETIAYNENGIRNITFHYQGDEDDLERLIRLIIKDSLVKNKIIEDFHAS